MSKTKGDATEAPKTDAGKLAPFAELLADLEVPDAKIAELAEVTVEAVKAARPSKAAPEPEPPPEPATAHEPAAPPPNVHPELHALVDRLGQAFGTSSQEVADLIAQIRASEHLDKLDPTDRLGLEGMLTEIEGKLAETEAGLTHADTESPPHTVQILGQYVLKGPDGRPWPVFHYDAFSGEQAAWLWQHHREKVRAYPPPKAPKPAAE